MGTSTVIHIHIRTTLTGGLCNQTLHEAITITNNNNNISKSMNGHRRKELTIYGQVTSMLMKNDMNQIRCY